ncbi:MAG: hypothetical protein ACLGHT_12395, partial [Acidimicrobiia bacterium]
MRLYSERWLIDGTRGCGLAVIPANGAEGVGSDADPLWVESSMRGLAPENFLKKGLTDLSEWLGYEQMFDDGEQDEVVGREHMAAVRAVMASFSSAFDVNLVSAA